MSAYMVEREHIQYIVTAAFRMAYSPDKFRYYWNGWHEVNYGDRDAMTKLGQILWSENLKSINERYPDTAGHPENAPCKLDDVPFIYAHTSDWRGPINPVQVLKSLACLAYQSCETETWEKSEAFTILETIKDNTISKLPGYEKAEWGIPQLKAVKSYE